MDSVSQIVLGAAVSEAVIGKHVGRRALLWGAVAGTLPDLDVFVPFDDPVKNFTYHRGLTHSLFILTLITPALTWLITKIHPSTGQYRNRWGWAVWLTLITHTVLDCFTVYGTQIFWPFSEYPVTWSTIFIIDPMYTVWLIIGVLFALNMSRNYDTGHRLNGVGLLLSSIYLLFTVGGKVYIERIVDSTIERQQIPHTEVLTTPAPFNTLLWRIVIVGEEGYYEGFYSFLDRSDMVQFTKYQSRPELLDEIQESWAVQRVQWFTKGVYRVLEKEGEIIMTDLRMGQEPFYTFSFIVGRREGGEITPVPTARAPTERGGLDQIKWVWKRIWSETAR